MKIPLPPHIRMNLSVFRRIEQCPTSEFLQMLAEVPKNIFGKVNNSLFYKLQVELKNSQFYKVSKLRHFYLDYQVKHLLKLE